MASEGVKTRPLLNTQEGMHRPWSIRHQGMRTKPGGEWGLVSSCLDYLIVLEWVYISPARSSRPKLSIRTVALKQKRVPWNITFFPACPGSLWNCSVHWYLCSMSIAVLGHNGSDPFWLFPLPIIYPAPESSDGDSPGSQLAWNFCWVTLARLIVEQPSITYILSDTSRYNKMFFHLWLGVMWSGFPLLDYVWYG